MTRTAAREIAIHCAYSLGFSRQSAEELLQERLDRARFLQWGEEDPLYREYPNEKQLQYIQDVVRGVAEHGPELDQYIAQYAKNWNFARMPSCVWRCTKSSTGPISPPLPPSTTQ